MSWEKFFDDIFFKQLPFLLKKLLSCLFNLFSEIITLYICLFVFKTSKESSRAEFVLAFYKVPILNKVSQKINYAVSSHLKGDIMPRHTNLKILVEIGFIIITGFVNIFSSVVVIITSIP